MMECWADPLSCLPAGIEPLWARPITYVEGLLPAEKPWIVEEDTASAGSRIAIHDSSMFDGYDDEYDTVPDRNFRFVYTLCMVFP